MGGETHRTVIMKYLWEWMLIMWKWELIGVQRQSINRNHIETFCVIQLLFQTSEFQFSSFHDVHGAKCIDRGDEPDELGFFFIIFHHRGSSIDPRARWWICQTSLWSPWFHPVSPPIVSSKVTDMWRGTYPFTKVLVTQVRVFVFVMVETAISYALQNNTKISTGTITCRWKAKCIWKEAIHIGSSTLA